MILHGWPQKQMFIEKCLLYKMNIWSKQDGRGMWHADYNKLAHVEEFDTWSS